MPTIKQFLHCYLLSGSTACVRLFLRCAFRHTTSCHRNASRPRKTCCENNKSNRTLTNTSRACLLMHQLCVICCASAGLAQTSRSVFCRSVGKNCSCSATPSNTSRYGLNGRFCGGSSTFDRIQFCSQG